MKNRKTSHYVPSCKKKDIIICERNLKKNGGKVKTGKLISKPFKLSDVLEFALFVTDDLEYNNRHYPKFGGFVELDTFCKCGCSTIAEIYFEGIFRCLKCGTRRN